MRARVVGQLPVPVSRAAAALVGNRIVVMGGLGPGDVTTDRVVVVSASGRHAVAGGRLVQGVHDAPGATVGGHAVVFGGGASTETSGVQSWRGGTTRLIGRLPQPRSDATSAAVGGTAFVVGGFDGTAMTRVVLATTDGRQFRRVARLRVGVRYPAVAVSGGVIYVFGGQLATTEGTSSGAQSRLVQRIDVRTGTVRVVGRLPWSIGHAMAFALGGRLYLAGGRRGTRATASVWQVDPTTARVTRVGRLPHPISDSAVVPMGAAVALIGGETTGPFAPQRSIVVVR